MVSVFGRKDTRFSTKWNFWGGKAYTKNIDFTPTQKESHAGRQGESVNTMKKIGTRCFQKAIFAAQCIAPWRIPNQIWEAGGIQKCADILAERKCKAVLIVTTAGAVKRGMLIRLTKQLEGKGIRFALFDQAAENPTVEHIEAGYTQYRVFGADSLIAVGGGSVIDCAKLIGAKAVRPNWNVGQMRGLMKVHRRLPPLIAVPTTAGSGSEGTLAAVVTDEKQHVKYSVNDISLIPHYAVFDVNLLYTLPQDRTAQTGMDALTHGVEAFLGQSGTKFSNRFAKLSVQRVFQHLLLAYEVPENTVARHGMQEAAFYAGLAFTRAYVGYVHALSHAVGAFYHTPHGLANAVLLPKVLRAYGSAVEGKLAKLAEEAGIRHGTVRQKAEQFIVAIETLNAKMHIPENLPEIRRADIPALICHTMQECIPLYPVPKFLDEKILEKILNDAAG